MNGPETETTQTINPDTATIEECALWLAELTVLCTNCAGTGFSGWTLSTGDAGDGISVDCLPCNGTGTVPRYPSLREPCPQTDDEGLTYHVCPESDIEGLAVPQNCRGWGAVENLSVLLTDVEEIRLRRSAALYMRPFHFRNPLGSDTWFEAWVPCKHMEHTDSWDARINDWSCTLVRASDPTLAAYRALVKVELTR